jgi:hypothetical protein
MITVILSIFSLFSCVNKSENIDEHPFYSEITFSDIIEIFDSIYKPSAPVVEIIDQLQATNDYDGIMLDYILKKNDIYMEKITKGAYIDMYEITDYIKDENNNKKTIKYIFDLTEVQSINEHYIVDKQILMDLFELTFEEANHESGDYFDSENDAALAFTLMYLQESTHADMEYTAFIYSDDETFCEYDGFHITPIIKYFYGEVSKNGLQEANADYPVAGWVHTHGNHGSYICNSCFCIY